MNYRNKRYLASFFHIMAASMLSISHCQNKYLKIIDDIEKQPTAFFSSSSDLSSEVKLVLPVFHLSHKFKEKTRKSILCPS